MGWGEHYGWKLPIKKPHPANLYAFGQQKLLPNNSVKKNKTLFWKIFQPCGKDKSLPVHIFFVYCHFREEEVTSNYDIQWHIFFFILLAKFKLTLAECHLACFESLEKYRKNICDERSELFAFSSINVTYLVVLYFVFCTTTYERSITETSDLRAWPLIYFFLSWLLTSFML